MWKSSKYDFCHHHVRFSELSIVAPDAMIKLDCFEATNLTIEDTDQSHVHIFAERPTSSGLVDVTLQNGDLFVWEDQAVPSPRR